MLDFKKNHSHLICIDSDGTIMDTMTIKHKLCFGPSFLEIFSITHHQEEILEYWLNINLYSMTRGINRFVGLDMAIAYVQKFGYFYKDSDVYHQWVETTNSYSVTSIQNFMKDKDSYTLQLALDWSNLVNEKISKLPPSVAFNGVEETLKEANLSCDLLGVSSANPQAVYEEWYRLDLMKYFQFVACQDKGTKTNIIRLAKEKGYTQYIMIGDALGDLEAARKNEIYFFPIIPTKEATSWERFKKEALPKFISNTYTADYQQQLIDEFILFLKGGKTK